MFQRHICEQMSVKFFLKWWKEINFVKLEIRRNTFFPIKYFIMQTWLTLILSTTIISYTALSKQKKKYCIIRIVHDVQFECFQVTVNWSLSNCQILFLNRCSSMHNKVEGNLQFIFFKLFAFLHTCEYSFISL